MPDSPPPRSLWRRAGSRLLEYLRVYLNNRRAPLYREWYFQHRPDLKRFKDCHEGEDCFILGNGPSLNEMDLEPLQEYHTFGLNKIYLMAERGIDLNLSYLVSVNDHVIEQSADVFESLSCETFLAYAAAHNCVRPRNHINFIFTGGPYTFQKDLQKRVYQGYTVTFVAMQIAFYMGFDRVFLVGVDHSFDVDGDPNEVQEMNQDDVNHFDPDYFKGDDWELPDLEASELSYHLARFFFRRNGRQIIDATVGGELDIYPKISYEEALSRCRPARTMARA